MSSVKYVPGVGSIRPGIIFVGEAPGQEEERLGRPFVGRSGKLLDKMIVFLGLRRPDVYITNIVKVRPPANRTPTEEEIDSWRQSLYDELSELVKSSLDFGIHPVIVTLGASATKALLGSAAKISQIRGMALTHEPTQCTIVPTYHPAYLLRNPSAKELVKKDLLLAKSKVTTRGPESK